MILTKGKLPTKGKMGVLYFTSQLLLEQNREEMEKQMENSLTSSGYHSLLNSSKGKLP